MNKFFKKLAVLLSFVMVFTAMPMSVFAETVVEVADTAALQQALDSAVTGTTIQLKAGVEYGAVSVRPTAKNETTMYCGTHDYTTTNAEEFKAHLAEAVYHTTPDYTTNFKNITINGADGAVIAGLLISSGHVYGDVYDYVRDIDYDSGSAYYCTLNVENFTVNNVNFTGKIDINTSDADSVYNGVTFNGCTFTTGGTESGNGAAIRYYNEANNGNVKNIVVNNCQFTNCYQGVYVHHVNGVKVTGSTFDTTGHNAIAMQSHDGAVALKEVVITGNTFKNINDRIIRFGDVGADSDITIQNNTATNSGDEDDEVVKATSIASGVKTSVKDNNWGGGIVVNDELKQAVAMVGSTQFKSLQEAVNAANGGTVTLLTDVTLDATLALENTITIDGAGYKLIPADTTKTYSSVVMAGNSGWGDPAETSPKITLKNLDISGWTTSEGVVRAQGVTLEVEGCTFKNNTVTTAAYGVVSVNYANGIVKNSKFENNTGKAIDANYNVGDSTATTAVIEGCTFTGNTSAYTGIVVRNDGTKFTVKNSTFTNNTVNTAGNAATLYSGWGTEDEISGCTFTGNTVTSTSANAKRFASAIFCDGCKVNGNKFQNNTATLDGSAHSTTVAVGGYYGPSDISGNYWGGAEPVKDVDYTANYTYETVANDNYYSDAELTNLVCICNMDELVTVPEVKATCTTDGTKTHEKCETCGKLYVDGAVVTPESLVIPATGHAFGEWVVDEAAGVKTRTCKNGCGETETAKLPVTEEAETLPNNVQTEVKLPDVVEEDTPVEVETVVQVSKDEETKEEATEALEATAATVVSTIVEATNTSKTTEKVVEELKLEDDEAGSAAEFVEFVQDNATNEEGGVLLTITKEPVVEKMENVPEADKAKITVAEGAAVEYLDIKVKITATANGESVTALVSELDKPMPITFAYPADWNEGVKEGMGRKFILKFVHDGVAGEVEAVDNGNNTVTAYVDQFSTYALTYVDVPAAHNHTWGYNTTFDAAAHWDYCHVCGAQNTPVAHSDADGNGFCDCGWNFAATSNRANPNTGVTADMFK